MTAALMTPPSPKLQTLTKAQLIERLRQQEAENVILWRKNASLRADLIACRARICTLDADLTAAVTRADLTEKLLADARAQLKKNSTNSHMPPSSDGPAVKKPSPPAPTTPNKRGKRPDTPPFKRLLRDAPDAIINTKLVTCALRHTACR
jgi:hypothetical protein